MKETVSKAYHRRELKKLRAVMGSLVPGARRVRDAWLRGGAGTEDMKAACSIVDEALRRLKK